jgi:uncharacterized membrane protein YhaH (DUF805 family)
MKQLLIQILSALVGNEAKIEIKKPKINFKEGFRRIVAVCCLIGFVCGACSGEFVTALSCSALCYIGYLCLEILLCWIASGFSGEQKTRKRTLLQELKLRQKIWDRKIKRTCKKNEAIAEVEKTIIYNRNPFVPKGRMKRFDFFVYSFIVGLIMRLIGYETEKNPETISYCTICLWFFAFVVDIFIIRNRIFDITLSNKKSWSVSIIFQLICCIIELYSPYLRLITLPFGIALIAIPSKLVEDSTIKKEKEQSAFDMIKTIRN